VDRNIQHMLVDPTDGALRQLGWAPLNHPFLPHATPDDLEYLLAKSAAYDVPVMVVLFIYSLPNWANSAANWHLMKTYDELRLSGGLSFVSRLSAREPGKDFMKFTDEVGNHFLTAVSQLAIAANSPLVRGFITDDALRGDRFVTLWPVGNEGFTLRLPGVAPDALTARDYLGDRLDTTPSGGDLLVPLGSRIYIQLNDVPDPWWTFANATLSHGAP
jgi:hypothetical protein